MGVFETFGPLPEGVDHDQITYHVRGAHAIHVYADSDSAGDHRKRKSVDCIVAYLCEAPVHISTMGPCSIATGSAEEEFAGCAGAAMYGIRFHSMWLQWFGEALPVNVHMDSVAGKLLRVAGGDPCGAWMSSSSTSKSSPSAAG